MSLYWICNNRHYVSIGGFFSIRKEYYVLSFFDFQYIRMLNPSIWLMFLDLGCAHVCDKETTIFVHVIFSFVYTHSFYLIRYTNTLIRIIYTVYNACNSCESSGNVQFILSQMLLLLFIIIILNSFCWNKCCNWDKFAFYLEGSAIMKSK